MLNKFKICTLLLIVLFFSSCTASLGSLTGSSRSSNSYVDTVNLDGKGMEIEKFELTQNLEYTDRLVLVYQLILKNTGEFPATFKKEDIVFYTFQNQKKIITPIIKEKFFKEIFDSNENTNIITIKPNQQIDRVGEITIGEDYYKNEKNNPSIDFYLGFSYDYKTEIKNTNIGIRRNNLNKIEVLPFVAKQGSPIKTQEIKFFTLNEKDYVSIYFKNEISNSIKEIKINIGDFIFGVKTLDCDLYKFENQKKVKIEKEDFIFKKTGEIFILDCEIDKIEETFKTYQLIGELKYKYNVITKKSVTLLLNRDSVYVK